MGYPTCEDYARVADHINEFIDFYDQLDGIVLAKWKGNQLVPIRDNLQTLLMEYYDIDEAELERERAAILESIK